MTQTRSNLQKTKFSFGNVFETLQELHLGPYEKSDPNVFKFNFHNKNNILVKVKTSKVYHIYIYIIRNNIFSLGPFDQQIFPMPFDQRFFSMLFETYYQVIEHILMHHRFCFKASNTPEIKT